MSEIFTEAGLTPGQQLRRLRHAKGISMEAAGKRAQPPLNTGYLSLLETDGIETFHVSRLQRLSQAYDISVLELLGIYGVEVAIGKSALGTNEAEDLNRYKRALESLRTIQGPVIPVHNQEMIPVEWVLEVANKALNPAPQT